MENDDEFSEIMNTNQHVAEIVEKKENMKRFINQFIKFKSKFYNAYKIMATIQERLPEFLTMNDMKAMKSMMIDEIQGVIKIFKEEIEDMLERRLKEKVEYKYVQDQLNGKLDKFEISYFRSEFTK